jgi:outer membrane protein TolC
MLRNRHPWLNLPWRTALGMTVGLGLIGEAPAAEPEPIAAPVTKEAAAPVYNLAECVGVAIERQPSLAAVRASLNAAQAGQAGLNNLGPLAGLVAKDLKVRKHQASLGVASASAELQQAEYDAIFAVTRMYYTAVFARLQLDVANETADSIRKNRGIIQKALDEGVASRELNKGTVDKLTIYLGLTESKREEAAAGVDRALAGLREAMGVGPDCAFTVATKQLPEMKLEVTKDQIVALALSRRGEVAQTSIGAEAFRLEVDAQSRVKFRRTVPTLASGTDIHVKPVPQGVSDENNYRPGGIGFEMPVNLNGDRDTRTGRASALSQRADAVADKTRGLVSLEAEDAFLRWVESGAKVKTTREAKEAADRLKQFTENQVKNALGNVIEETLRNDITAGQAKAAFNEALFQQVLALAALERVTAGGVQANFPDRVAPVKP